MRFIGRIVEFIVLLAATLLLLWAVLWLTGGTR